MSFNQPLGKPTNRPPAKVDEEEKWLPTDKPHIQRSSKTGYLRNVAPPPPPEPATWLPDLWQRFLGGL